MKMPKNCINILLVGLDNDFCKCVAEELAGQLQMNFTDCGDIVDYFVQEKDLILQNIGVSYLKKEEKKALKNCSNYYNCVMSINFDYFKMNNKAFNKSVICYLQLKNDKKMSVIDKIAYQSRNEFLTENSHIVLKISKRDVKKTVKSLMKNLGEIL